MIILTLRSEWNTEYSVVKVNDTYRIQRTDISNGRIAKTSSVFPCQAFDDWIFGCTGSARHNDKAKWKFVYANLEAEELLDHDGEPLWYYLPAGSLRSKRMAATQQNAKQSERRNARDCFLTAGAAVGVSAVCAPLAVPALALAWCCGVIGTQKAISAV